LGRNLANSVEHFNSAVGSLERQVLPGARKFTELGVRPDREIEPLEPIDKLVREPVENGERPRISQPGAPPANDSLP
jgi:DNA recombination protein RmuC